MNDPCASRDLVKKPAAAWLLWGLPIAIILITGNVASAGWILTVAWAASLVTMGVACLVNARGCGRTHCYFTGPFFLLMAIMSLLHGLHVVSLGPRGWSYIGIVLLIGSIVLCAAPELIWGRYRYSE